MNFGLDLEKETLSHSNEDYIFGASSPVCIASVPENKREENLPIGEVQKAKEDTMDCATRSAINILETKFNYLLNEGLLTEPELQFLVENGYYTDGGIEFSDAFIAIKSGTTRSGNSLKAPLQAINDYGLVPKVLMPLEPTMTWSEYHNPSRITTEIGNLGKQFNEIFTIRYERVPLDDFDTVLKTDMLDTAGYAWSQPDTNGVYPATENVPNHAFMTHALKYFAFDYYRDSFDGDFIKHLASDFSFLGYGYRLYITRNEEPAENEQQQLISDIIEMVISLLQKLRFVLGLK